MIQHGLSYSVVATSFRAIKCILNISLLSPVCYRPSLVSQYLAKDNSSVKDKISLSNHEMVTVPER